MNAARGRSYDVIILGSGIGGTALACILAKHGVRTLLVEELSHPRFTIGESLIPETGVRLQILGEKYGVPEIGWIGSFHQLRDHVSAACGVKRSFVFAWHSEGRPQDPAHSNQLPTLTPPFGPDAHLYRQDTDAFLAAAAVRYGADLIQQAKVAGVDFHPDRVDVRMVSGETYRADFLIDAGGMRSHVATQLNLRDATPRFATDTRALYTHFIGLPPYDFFGGARSEHKLDSPYSEGTLHHVFDGGWMWVIPFNNHREATNPLVSVGLMLDRRRYPEPSAAGPEAEFRSFVSRFPSVAKHFASARAVRPWVATRRIQYSSAHAIAHRLIQLPHAAAFIDPLFSSGMSVLTVAIDVMAAALLPALAERRYDVERFQFVEDFTLSGFEHYDHVVSNSFSSFGNWDLWNAWNRVWMMGNYLGTWSSLNLLLRYIETGDRKWLDMSHTPDRAGVLGSNIPEMRAIIREAAGHVGAARRGDISPREASEQIFARLGAADFVPPFLGFGKPEQRSPTTFTIMTGARQLLWYRFAAPEAWRNRFAFNIFTYLGQVARFAGASAGDGLRRATQSWRDFLFGWNSDWKFRPKALDAPGQYYQSEGGELLLDAPAANAAAEMPATAQVISAPAVTAVPVAPVSPVQAVPPVSSGRAAP